MLISLCIKSAILAALIQRELGPIVLVSYKQLRYAEPIRFSCLGKDH